MENSEIVPMWRQDQQISIENFNWNHNSQQEEVIQENSIQESEGKYAQSSQQKKDRKVLDNIQISDLHLKKKNLIQFINNIGPLANQPISRDVLSHCQKVTSGIYKCITGDQITRLAKNRVQKMIKNKRIKKNWSQEDIKILIWIVSKYCQMRGSSFSKDTLQESDWQFIANLIPGVTPKNCMFKWLGLKKNNLAENNWTTEESNLLNKLVKQHGIQKWGTISQQLYEYNSSLTKIYRCPKQCRQHWNCYLDPKLKKGPWQKKQDILLLKSVKYLDGAKKWAEIVKLFNGRTQNALKNRFNLIIEKQCKENRGRKRMKQQELIDSYLKKYQSMVVIDESKLLKLKDKKQMIAQSKKNLKNTIPILRRQSKKSMKKYCLSDDSEDYDPRQWECVKQRKSQRKCVKVQQPPYHNFQNRQQQQHSYDNICKRRQDQDPIFQQQQELDFDQKSNLRQKNIDSQFQLFQYKNDVMQTPQRKNSMNNSKVHHPNFDEIGTNQQNLHINMQNVQVVSLDYTNFQKLKSQFSHQGHQFFACKVTQDNHIIKFKPQDQ